MLRALRPAGGKSLRVDTATPVVSGRNDPPSTRRFRQKRPTETQSFPAETTHGDTVASGRSDPLGREPPVDSRAINLDGSLVDINNDPSG